MAFEDFLAKEEPKKPQAPKSFDDFIDTSKPSVKTEGDGFGFNQSTSQAFSTYYSPEIDREAQEVSSLTGINDTERQYLYQLKKTQPEKYEEAKKVISGEWKDEYFDPNNPEYAKTKKNTNDFVAGVDKLWHGSKYYIDPQSGMPVPLKPGQKVPVGAKVASAFSDFSEDDNLFTQGLKSFYNTALDVFKFVPNIAEVGQGLITGKESKGYVDMMNAIDSWKLDTKDTKEIVSLDAFMAGNDFWQKENFGDAGAWANFTGQVFGSLAQFIGGGWVTGSMKAGEMAAAKIAANQAVKKSLGQSVTVANKTADWFIKNKAMLGVSSAISLNEPLDAADRAGITGRDKYLLAATIAPVMGVIEIALGIDAKILSAIQKTGAKKLMAEAAAKVVKDAGGELTEEVLKKAFAETLKTATRTIPGVLKTIAINTGQEMTEEVLQTVWTKLVEKQYDHIKGYEGEGGDGGFGTEMLSPEAYKDYFMSAVGGAIGGFGGSVVLGGLKDSTKSHNLYEAATNPKEKLKLLQSLNALVKDGKLSQEGYDMANFRLESYERYNRDVAKTGMPEENKRKAFDLIWQAENAKEEIKTLEAQIGKKTNPADADPLIEAQYQNTKGRLSAYVNELAALMSGDQKAKEAAAAKTSKKDSGFESNKTSSKTNQADGFLNNEEVKQKKIDVQQKHNVTIEDNIGDIGVELELNYDPSEDTEQRKKRYDAAKEELEAAGITVRDKFKSIVKKKAEPKQDENKEVGNVAQAAAAKTLTKESMVGEKFAAASNKFKNFETETRNLSKDELGEDYYSAVVEVESMPENGKKGKLVVGMFNSKQEANEYIANNSKETAKVEETKEEVKREAKEEALKNRTIEDVEAELSKVISEKERKKNVHANLASKNSLKKSDKEIDEEFDSQIKSLTEERNKLKETNKKDVHDNSIEVKKANIEKLEKQLEVTKATIPVNKKGVESLQQQIDEKNAELAALENKKEESKPEVAEKKKRGRPKKTTEEIKKEFKEKKKKEKVEKKTRTKKEKVNKEVKQTPSSEEVAKLTPDKKFEVLVNELNSRKDKKAKATLMQSQDGKLFYVVSAKGNRFNFARNTDESRKASQPFVGQKVTLKVVPQSEWNADGAIKDVNGVPYGDRVAVIAPNGVELNNIQATNWKAQATKEETKTEPVEQKEETVEEKETVESEETVEAPPSMLNKKVVAAENKTTVSGESIQALRDFIKKVRITGAKSDPFLFATAWNAALDVLDLALAGAKTVKQAFDAAKESLVNSEWYKNATKKDRHIGELKFQNFLNESMRIQNDQKLSQEEKDAALEQLDKRITEEFSDMLEDGKMSIGEADARLKEWLSKIKDAYSGMEEFESDNHAKMYMSEFLRKHNINAANANDVLLEVYGNALNDDMSAKDVQEAAIAKRLHDIFLKDRAKFIFTNNILSSLRYNPVYELHRDANGNMVIKGINQESEADLNRKFKEIMSTMTDKEFDAKVKEWFNGRKALLGDRNALLDHDLKYAKEITGLDFEPLLNSQYNRANIPTESFSSGKKLNEVATYREGFVNPAMLGNKNPIYFMFSDSGQFRSKEQFVSHMTTSKKKEGSPINKLAIEKGKDDKLKPSYKGADYANNPTEEFVSDIALKFEIVKKFAEESKYYKKNDFVQNNKDGIPYVTINGMKDYKTGNVSTKKQLSPDDMFLMVAELFHAKKDGKFMMPIGKMGDKDSIVVVPGKVYDNAEERYKEVLAEYGWSPKRIESHLAKLEKEIEYVKNNITKKVKGFQPDANREFVFNYALNKHFVDDFIHGKESNYYKKDDPNKTEEQNLISNVINAAKEIVKRGGSSISKGWQLDSTVEGGVGKTFKIVKIEAPQITDPTGGSEDSVSLNDGGMWHIGEFDDKIKVSSGSANIHGSLKAIYSETMLEGERFLNKTHSANINPYAELNLKEYQKRTGEQADATIDTFDFSKVKDTTGLGYLAIYQYMKINKVDMLSTTDGMKKSNVKAIPLLSGTKVNVEALKVIPDTETKSYVAEMNTSNLLIQQDLRNNGRFTESSEPKQAKYIELAMPNSKVRQVLYNKISKIFIDENIDWLKKATPKEILKFIEKHELEEILDESIEVAEKNDLTWSEKLARIGVSFLNPIVGKRIDSVAVSKLGRETLGRLSNKAILITVPNLGLDTRSLRKDKNGNVLLPESYVPKSLGLRNPSKPMSKGAAMAAAKKLPDMLDANGKVKEWELEEVSPGMFVVPGEAHFVTRIPADGFHSVHLMRVKGTLPNGTMNSIVVDSKTQNLDGSDHDGDVYHVEGLFKGEKINDAQGLYNKSFTARMNDYYSSEFYDQFNSGINLKYFDKIVELLRQNEEVFDKNQISAYVDSNTKNGVGLKVVGIVAKAAQTYSLLRHINGTTGTKDAKGKNIPFVFPSLSLGSKSGKAIVNSNKSHTGFTKDIKIAKLIGNLLNAALDGVKNPIIETLGLNEHTAGMFMFALNSKPNDVDADAHFKSVVAFFNLPIVRDYVKRKRELGNIYNNITEEKVFVDMIEDYAGGVIESGVPVSEFLSKNLGKQEFDINNPLALIAKIKEIEMLSNSVGQIDRLLGLVEDGGLPKSWDDYYVMEGIYQKVKTNTLHGIGLKGFESHPIFEAIGMSIDLSRAYFAKDIMNTKTAQSLVNSMEASKTTDKTKMADGNYKKLSKSEINAISKTINSAMMSLAMEDSMDIADLRTKVKELFAANANKENSFYQLLESVDEYGQVDIKVKFTLKAVDHTEAELQEYRDKFEALPAEEKKLLRNYAVHQYGMVANTFNGGWALFFGEQTQLELSEKLEDVRAQFEKGEHMYEVKDLLEKNHGNEFKFGEKYAALTKAKESKARKFYQILKGQILERSIPSKLMNTIKSGTPTFSQANYYVGQQISFTDNETGEKVLATVASKAKSATKELSFDYTFKIGKSSEQKQSINNESATELTNTLDNLSKKFGIEYEFDTNQTTLGRFQKGKVYINPDLAKADTAFHEFAHPFEQMIKKANPALWSNLLKEAYKAQHNGKSIAQFVMQNYPNLKGEDLSSEIIVTAIGLAATNKITSIKNKGLVAAIKDFFQKLTEYLSEAFGKGKVASLSSHTTIQQLADMMRDDAAISLDVNIKETADNQTASFLNEETENLKSDDEIRQSIIDALGKNPEDVDISDMNAISEKALTPKECKELGVIDDLRGQSHFELKGKKEKLSSSKERVPFTLEEFRNEDIRLRNYTGRSKVKQVKELYENYLREYEYIDKKIWPRILGPLSRGVDPAAIFGPNGVVNDLLAEVEDFNSIAADHIKALLYDRATKAFIISEMIEENKRGYVGPKPATRTFNSLLNGHAIKDFMNNPLISGDYSYLSPSKVSKPMLQLREMTWERTMRQVLAEQEDAMNQMQDLKDKVMKTKRKGDSNPFADIIYTDHNGNLAFIDLKRFNSSVSAPANTKQTEDRRKAMALLAEKSERSQALIDFLNGYTNILKQYNNDHNLKVPQVMADMPELIKTFGFKEAFRAKIYQKSNFDDISVRVEVLGNKIMTIAEARKLLVEDEKNVLKKAKNLFHYGKLLKEASKHQDDNIDANGKIITVGQRKIGSPVSFSKDKYATKNIGDALLRHINNIILEENVKPIIPILEGVKNFYGQKRANKPEILKWLNGLDSKNIYGKTPESILGPYGAILQGFTNYTHWMMLGLNLPGSIYNAMAGLTQTMTQHGPMVMIKGVHRLFVGFSFTGKFDTAFNTSIALNMMRKLHTVNTSMNVELSVTNKTISRVSNIVFSPITFVEYLNHAYSYLGLMEDHEWEAIKKLGKDASATDLIKAIGVDRANQLENETQRINGSYSAFTKRGVNNTPEGRAFMQFKNWLPDVVLSLIEPEYHNMYLGNQKGLLNTVIFEGKVKVPFQMFYDLLSGGPDQARARWNEMSQVDQANMRKFGRQLITIAGLMAVAAAMSGDREKEKMLKRMIGDVGFIYDFKNIEDLLKAPAPAVMSTMVNMVKTSREVALLSVGLGQEYKRDGKGYKKGDSIALKGVKDLLPFKSFRKLLSEN
jgi:hypothetical protein